MDSGIVVVALLGTFQHAIATDRLIAGQARRTGPAELELAEQTAVEGQVVAVVALFRAFDDAVATDRRRAGRVRQVAHPARFELAAPTAAVAIGGVAVVAGLEPSNDAVATGLRAARRAVYWTVEAELDPGAGLIAAVAADVIAVLAPLSGFSRPIATRIQRTGCTGKTTEIAALHLAVGATAVASRGVRVVAGLGVGDQPIAAVRIGLAVGSAAAVPAVVLTVVAGLLCEARKQSGPQVPYEPSLRPSSHCSRGVSRTPLPQVALMQREPATGHTFVTCCSSCAARLSLEGHSICCLVFQPIACFRLA